MDAAITIGTNGYPLHRKSCACPEQDVGPYQPDCLICRGHGSHLDDACECVECCAITEAADKRHMEAA